MYSSAQDVASNQETFLLAARSGPSIETSNMILTPHSKKKGINVMLLCEPIPGEHPTEVYSRYCKLHLPIASLKTALTED